MPEPNNGIIGELEPAGSNGKSDAFSDTKSTVGTPDGNSGDTSPYGFDPIEPASFEPVIIGTGDAYGDAPPKRRGRKPGSRNATRNTGADTPAAKNDHLAGIEKTLEYIHNALAALTGVKYLVLDPSEAKDYATALREFAKFHEVPVLSEKHMATFNLLVCMGGIYSTRFMAWQMDRAEAKKKGPQPVPINRPAQAEPAPPINKTNGAPAVGLSPNDVWFQPVKESGGDF